MSLVRRGVTALITDGCGERRDNTPCAIDLNDGTEAFRNNQRQGLWAPAFARATYERYLNKIRENDGSAHGRGRRRGDRPPRSPR